MQTARSTIPTWGTAALEDLLNDFLNDYNGVAILHLFSTGPGSILPTALLSSFVDPTFAGYAAGVIALTGSPLLAPSGNSMFMLFNRKWICVSAPAVAQNVEGYYLDDGAGNFLAGEYFPQPIQVANVGDGVDLRLLFPLPFVVDTR